jgi:hypothetical protein
MCTSVSLENKIKIFLHHSVESERISLLPKGSHLLIYISHLGHHPCLLGKGETQLYSVCEVPQITERRRVGAGTKINMEKGGPMMTMGIHAPLAGMYILERTFKVDLSSVVIDFGLGQFWIKSKWSKVESNVKQVKSEGFIQVKIDCAQIKVPR